MGVLHAFCRHWNIIFIHFYWLFLLGSVLRFLVPLSCVLQKPVIWILSKINWLIVAWCGIWVSGILTQITNSLISFLFFSLLVLLCGSFTGIFWERVLLTFEMIFINFNRSFKSLIRNFLIELHFAFIAFILILIILLYFAFLKLFRWI